MRTKLFTAAAAAGLAGLAGASTGLAGDLAGGSGYPGINDEMGGIVQQVGNGNIPVDLPNFFVRRHSFYHNVTSATGTGTTWFNVAAAENTTNLNGSGGLANNTAFWMTGMSISMVLAPGATVGALTQAQADLFAAWMQHGLVKLDVGERAAARFVGPWRAGTGVNLQGLTTDSTTAGATQFHQLANYVDPWKFTPWFLILPSKPVTLTVTSPVSITLGTAFTLRAELHGIFITPSNN